MKGITANKEILGGKPIIKGTQTSVEFILELLASGVTEYAILLDYPHLKLEQVHDAISYYFEHKEMFDKKFREDQAIRIQLKKKYPSNLIDKCSI